MNPQTSLPINLSSARRVWCPQSTDLEEPLDPEVRRVEDSLEVEGQVEQHTLMEPAPAENPSQQPTLEPMASGDSEGSMETSRDMNPMDVLCWAIRHEDLGLNVEKETQLERDPRGDRQEIENTEEEDYRVMKHPRSEEGPNKNDWDNGDIGKANHFFAKDTLRIHQDEVRFPEIEDRFQCFLASRRQGKTEEVYRKTLPTVKSLSLTKVVENLPNSPCNQETTGKTSEK